jgi:hypothetical protein
MTLYQQLLLPNEKPTTKYKLPDYGAKLKRNKALLNRAARDGKLRDERRVLLLVMAMIETQHLSPDERDTSKDKKTDGSANATIFNLSEDLLRQLGYRGTIRALDPLERLPDVVSLIDKGIDLWNVSSFLDFVRGGRTAFNDHKSYRAGEYRTGVATGLWVIDMNPALIDDSRRIEMNVSHQ